MDPEQFAERLAALHADGYGWALACCRRDPEAAREVLQMTYVKILDGQARFDGRSSLKTWLFAVLRRTAAEHRRRARWSALRFLQPGAGESAPANEAAAGMSATADGPPPPPDAAAGSARAARAVSEALRRLSDRQREMIHLVFYEGMTIEQAAGVLGLGLGTARSHYERGKKRLRALLPPEAKP